MRAFSYLVFIILTGTLSLNAQKPEKIITDQSLVSVSYSWSADTIYILDGLVYLEENGCLKIEAGTLVKAKTNPSTGDEISALIVTRNAQITAIGQYLNPIVFTSELDDLPNDPLNKYDRGLWGGLIILGNAKVSNSADNFITSHIPFPDQEDDRNLFGGGDDQDNSGVLNFVSIRYAGKGFGNQNMAGLVLAGVGEQTTLDYIEVFASGGDGFAFFGGAPELSHLSSAFCGDDAYDWDMGFKGKGQFWFSIQSEDQADYGIEGKGITSNPVLYNLTLIGSGQDAEANNPGAIIFKEGSAGTIGMSIFTDFPNYAVEIEDNQENNDSYSKLQNGNLRFVSNIWSDIGAGNTFSSGENGIIRVGENADDPDATLFAEHLTMNDTIQANILPNISRENNRSLDPDLSFDEFGIDFELYPQDTFFIPYLDGTCYGRGGFIENGAWWVKYWTELDQEDYLRHPCITDFIETLDFYGIEGDTILVECSDAESIGQNIYYLCSNSKCFFGEQTLAVAMRMRRKNRKKSLINDEYCFLEEWIWEGEETAALYNPYVPEFTVLDTFMYRMTVLIEDTQAPHEFDIVPCKNCPSKLPFEVIPIDCDTAWIIGESHDTLVSDLDIVEHSWKATDYCGNESTFSITEHMKNLVFEQYKDRDQDGYGDERTLINWTDFLPGYTDRPGDCDDQNPQSNEGLEEDPLTIFDDDCDGFGNIDDCFDTDFLEVSDSCVSSIYSNINASLYLPSAAFTECNFLDKEYDVDVWFKVISPSSGSFSIDISEYSEKPVSYVIIQAFKEDCDNLELLKCEQTGSEELLGKMELTDIPPGDTVLIQVIGSSFFGQGGFAICAKENSSTTAIDEIKKDLPPIMKIIPNPVKQAFQLLLNLPDKNQPYVLSLIDLFGNEVKRIVDNSQPNKRIEKLWVDSSYLPEGVYFINLRIGEFNITKRLFKIRP